MAELGDPGPGEPEIETVSAAPAGAATVSDATPADATPADATPAGATPAGATPALSRLGRSRSRLVAALLSIPGMSAILAGRNSRSSSSPKGRSRLVAAVLSFVWPGLGQLYAGRRVAAAILAVPVVLAAVWLALQFTSGLDYFVASFTIDSFALTFVVGAAIFGVWRIAAMIHAYATTGPRRRPTALEAVAVEVLILIVVAVHAEVINYSWSAYRFDVDLPNNTLVANPPTQQPTSPPAPTPSPTPAWTPGSSYALPSATPTAPPPPSHRITILLTGMDWMPGRNHALNDALMLVSLDTATRKVAMISVPRDTSAYDLYWGGVTGPNSKINSLATLISQGKVHAPDPPLTALANQIGFLVGVKVDYYAAIDMTGFASMVDRLGGICVYNPKAINDPSTGTFIKAGTVCMNGTTALLYARSRHNGGSDYVRAGRQQEVLVAVAQKMATARGISALPGLLSLAATLIQTNFPLKSVRDYISIAQHLKATDITQCVLGPPYNYHPATSLTKGTWTSRLKLAKVAQLSVYTFGTDSRYYGMEGITPAPCGK